MGWREKMGMNPDEINSNTYIQKAQNIQKVEEKNKTETIAPFAPFAPKIENEKSIQQQYNALWLQAEKLADFIDNPGSTIPSKERTVKVPELQSMVQELDRLEKSGATPPGAKPMINPKIETPTENQDFKIPIKNVIHGQCAARCKQTGKCFSYAMFDGKPGKPKPCSPKDCKIKRENILTPQRMNK